MRKVGLRGGAGRCEKRVMVSFGGNDSLNTHYRQLLGLTAPWRVNLVKLDPADARVKIRVEWPA